MSSMYQKNIEKIKEIFKNLPDEESKYLAIINLGKKAPPLKEKEKTEPNMVDGCQSITYLISDIDEDGMMHFKANSNALISSGLAALLIMAYDKLPPKLVVDNPPTFLEDLGINASLSPNRANGLYQMYKKMKEDCEKYI